MPDTPLRIAIISKIMANYRNGFYKKLFSNPKLSVTVFCQNQIRGLNLHSIHRHFPSNTKVVPAISSNNGKIMWQFLPYKEIYSNYDIVVVDGNPRNVSQMFFASILRIVGKTVVIWSSGHSRNNINLSIKIRLFWWRLFNNFLMYNSNDIYFLLNNGFHKKNILSINNGLNQEAINSAIEYWDIDKLNNWKINKKLSKKHVILSSGRIFYVRYKLLLDILPKIVDLLPDFMWVLIGDGPDVGLIKGKIEQLKLSNHVIFVGKEFKEENLAPWFLSAQFFVHPYAIGLSLYHAFGYGLPVITHNSKETQGPEFVAFKEGETGLTYIDKNSNSLLMAIKSLFADQKLLKFMSTRVKKIVNEEYNTNIMAERFTEMMENIK